MKGWLAAAAVLAMVLPGCAGVVDEPQPDSTEPSTTSATASSTSASTTPDSTTATSSASSNSTTTSSAANSTATNSSTTTTTSSTSTTSNTTTTSSTTSSGTTNSSTSTSSTSTSSSSTSSSASSSSTSTSQAPQAPADHRWIPPQKASTRNWGSPTGKDIRPGVEVAWYEQVAPGLSVGAACTGNFIFHLDDMRYFIGAAAHCFDSSEGGTYPACGQFQSRPIGSAVIITAVDGTKYDGTLAYSSWLAMQAAGEANPSVCRNDLSLVEIPAAAVAQVHPAVIHFGGPTLPTSPHGLIAGNPVYAALSTDAYGAYVIEQGPRAAKGTFDFYDSDGWLLYTDFGTAGGSQGDSGGGLMGPGGVATGVLSTGLQSGEFEYANLWYGLAYMRAKVGWAPSLVTWSSFDASGNSG